MLIATVKTRLFLLAIVHMLIVSACGQSAKMNPGEDIVQSSRADTLSFYSNTLTKIVKVIVYRPGISLGEDAEHCPVVYLLHGAYGDYRQWPTLRPDLNLLADRYEVFFVCPDAGNSWYIDSPVIADSKYETFIISDLVSYIDRKYPTKPYKSGRAITGLSMGGHGAMYLAMRHSDMFGAAGSMSGALDYRPYEVLDHMMVPLLGPKTNTNNWNNYTAIAQIGRIKDGDLALILDCGTEDFILQSTKDFHQALDAAGIKHNYDLRPGSHENAFWRDALDYHLRFISIYFNHN